MVQRKFRAAYTQAKQGHKTEALPFRLLYTTFPISFSWLSNFNGCSSTPGAFVSRNDNRGFYNQGAHPCFLDLRRKKKYIKPCICVLNEVCSGHMSACVCACVRQPTSLNGVKEDRWGERDISVVVAPGTVSSQTPERTAHQEKQQKENWNGIRE